MGIAPGVQYAAAAAAGAAFGGGTVLAFRGADERRAAEVEAKLDALSPQEYKALSRAGDLPEAPQSTGLLVGLLGGGVGTLGVAYGGVAVLGNVGASFQEVVTGRKQYLPMRPAGLMMAFGAAAMGATLGAYALSQRD